MATIASRRLGAAASAASGRRSSPPSARGRRLVSAILVGAGRSRRMGSPTPKAFLDLGGKPLYLRSLEALASLPEVAETILVLPKDSCSRIEDRLSRRGAALRVSAVIAGGAERQDSVLLGLRRSSPSLPLVLVHDAARPLVRRKHLRAVIAAARRRGAAILAVPVRDTLKRERPSSRSLETIPRTGLWAAQTPQVFRRALLLRALETASRRGIRCTDDAAAVERLGASIALVPGDEGNFKITTREDLRRARAILAAGGGRA